MIHLWPIYRLQIRPEKSKMEALSRWQASEQFPAFQISLISLLVVALCSIVLHRIVSPSSHTTPTARPDVQAGANAKTNADNAFPLTAQRVSFFNFMLGTVCSVLCIGALFVWCISLGYVSPVLRNYALLSGLCLSVVVVSWKQFTGDANKQSVEDLLALIAVPLYAGMFFGTLYAVSAL